MTGPGGPFVSAPFILGPGPAGFDRRSLNIPVTVPAFTAGLFIVRVDATVTFSDGVTITATGDQQVCFVPALANGLCRLQMELLTPTLVACPPGQDYTATYRITNNDPVNSVNLTFSADSGQNAYMPTPLGAPGVIALSGGAAGVADHLPIVLGSGPVPQIVNPAGYMQPTLATGLFTLQPGASILQHVTISSHGPPTHTPGCLDGSCADQTSAVNGMFADGTPAAACAGFGFTVDGRGHATVESIGIGCGGSGMQLYEVFTGPIDLVDTVLGTSTDIMISGTPGQATATPLPGTTIVPPVAANLGLGDDEVSGQLAMGFELALGGICASTLSVGSNGNIFFGTDGAPDWSPTEIEFVDGETRLAAYWADLAPNLGGTIHVDMSPGLAIVTYLNVFAFGSIAPEVTMQIRITPSSIRIIYDALGGGYSMAPIVGLTNGIFPGVIPGSSDLSAGPVGPVAGSTDVRLSTDGAPVIGGAPMRLTTTGIPAGGLGSTLVSLGPCLNPGLPLSGPLFGAGCVQYVGAGFVNLGVVISTGCSSTIIFGPIPANPAFYGLPLCFQSGAFSNAGVLTSNALTSVAGV